MKRIYRLIWRSGFCGRVSSCSSTRIASCSDPGGSTRRPSSASCGPDAIRGCRIDADGHPTVGELEEYIRRTAQPSPIGLLAIERKAAGDVVGYCGLVEGAVSPDESEPAFELLRRVWGQGYATEAALLGVAVLVDLPLGAAQM